MGTVLYDFSNQNILVTGASRGIGFDIALAFANSGGKVTILADGDDVFAAAEALTKTTGSKVSALQCDIRDSEQVKSALDEFEHLDVLINNAGLERVTPLLGDDVEQVFKNIIDINVNGTFLVTRHAVPKMSRGGRIILTASIWSHTAVAEFSAYCASKHANLGFMRSMAHELAPKGINVNAVCPGWVKTDAAMLSLTKMSESTGVSEEKLLQDIVSEQVIGGLLEPVDIALSYLYLASDDAKNITGQSHVIDRGGVMN